MKLQSCCFHVLVCLGCHKKIPQTGGLKQQKFTLLYFWRLENLGTGSQHVGLLVRTLLPANRWPPSPCFPTWRRETAGVCLFISRHQSYWIRAPPLRIHLTLITSLKILFPIEPHGKTQFSPQHSLTRTRHLAPVSRSRLLGSWKPSCYLAGVIFGKA